MKKIALIEDNYYFLDNLRTLLIMKDFKIEVFKRLNEVEKGLETFNPDIILTDLNLPDGNGEDTITSIRNNKFFDYTPIIIITGTQDIDHSRLLNLGVYKVLTKPVSFETLHLNITRALNKRELHLSSNKLSNRVKKLFSLNSFAK